MATSNTLVSHAVVATTAPRSIRTHAKCCFALACPLAARVIHGRSHPATINIASQPHSYESCLTAAV
eukprot:4368479-Alexandrium_andersonii.AAC.1